MKSEGQIKQKLKQVVFRHRKNFIDARISRRPDNCRHQQRVHLPQHTGNRSALGVCFCDEIPDKRVCDSTMAGDRQARECSFFDCKHVVEDLKESFKRKVGLDGSEVNMGVLAKEYPDVAALMWALSPARKTPQREESRSEQSGIFAFFGDQTDEPDDIPEVPFAEVE